MFCPRLSLARLSLNALSVHIRPSELIQGKLVQIGVNAVRRRRCISGTATTRKPTSTTYKGDNNEGDTVEHEHESFDKTFIKALDAALLKHDGKSLSADQASRINVEVAALSRQLTQPNDPAPRTYNIDFLSSIVAPYRILKADGRPVADITRLLLAAMETATTPMTEKIRYNLDNVQDPFTVLVDGSREKEEHFYLEPDFTHQRARDESGSYHVEIRKCWYMDTLAKLDASEIGPVFCMFDKAWYSAIDPKRHAFKFTRPTTIAAGFDRCRFNFDRVPSKEKQKST